VLIDILHLVEIVAVAFSLHVVAMDEPQGRGVDAVAQTRPGRGAVGKDVAQMAVAMGGAHLRPDHAEADVTQLDDMGGSIGLVKLGQPQPLSYLSEEANSGSPETTST
jgi:hypothetical protein